ncbi:MAG: hypothetical protein LH480_16115 [Rubrivivax sp.]|nr:hypothetical protein [Rubrivivax sp.]
MPVNFSSRARAWREPEDNDFLSNRPGLQPQEPPAPRAPVATARPTTTLPPQAPTAPPFWAAGTPALPSALNDLPEPPAQEPAQAQAQAKAHADA